MNDRKKLIAFRWLWIDLESNLKEKVFELRLFNQKIIQKKFKKKTKEKIKKAKKKGRKLNIVDLWHKRDLLFQVIPILLRFFLNILKAIRWDKLFLEVDVATPDPALTGVLYGGLCAVKGSTDYFLPDAHIKFRPDFFNRFPRGSAETVFSIRMLNVVAPVSKMFFAMPKIKIVKTFILKKRR
ncbi:MAG: DUF2953 domain-containing protein [candidate division Zixibacteria bacterium]|nr:DUF2953 domain-containing protein [candidate division Zixibacteria bacterium]